MRHEFVLVGIDIPSWNIAQQRWRAPSIQEIDGRGFPTTVIALVRPVEIGHQIYGRDFEARVTIYSVWVQDAAGLVGAVGICGP